MYFLNTDYLAVVVHEDANMSVLDEVKPYNQDAAVIPVLWMGNLTCSNRSLQGVLNTPGDQKCLHQLHHMSEFSRSTTGLRQTRSARQQLGMIISAVDPYWGGGDFVYVRSNDALVKGSWATWDELWQTTLIPSAANQGFPVGVAMAPMSAGKFGWLQVAGLAVYKTGATVAS